MLADRKVVLGITGGIAAYKAASLTRLLVKEGAAVKVIMTSSAQEFITPLTLQTLSGQPVYTKMFTPRQENELTHIALAEFADLLVVAPATANVIGKIAGGIADDLLTTTVMATKSPVLFCPAMNANMLANPAVRENMEKLTARGYFLMTSAYGDLACKVEGMGRLPEPEEIVEEINTILTPKDLHGRNMLITAGPTREPLDPVRFITNYSSGKMGYALAIMARRRGANVTLISGPSALAPPRGVNFIGIATACEMLDAVLEHYKQANVIIKAAAVADYRPAERALSKIKKREGNLRLTLERNPDIIAELGRQKDNRIIIGFAMETENLVGNAIAKMETKNMDYIVANLLAQPGAGFQHDTNIVTIISRNGTREDLPLMNKMQVANRILDKVRFHNE